MSILITICARGGSKGIPGKNIKQVNGIPLMAYSIKCAKKFKEKYPDSDIVLSTDSLEIKKVAQQYGLYTDYMRPQELGGDTVGKIDVLKHVFDFCEKQNNKQYDFLLDLDVTAPLRNLEDLEKALTIISENQNAINLFSVSLPHRNPYFNMVEEGTDGYYKLVKQSGQLLLTRQSAPKVYDINASFYYYKRKFFELGYKGAITDRTLIYEIPHICFDLDHPMDYEYLSFLITQNKLDFEL